MYIQGMAKCFVSNVRCKSRICTLERILNTANGHMPKLKVEVKCEFLWACWQSASETGSRVKSLTPLLAIRILVPLWVVERLLRNGLSPPVAISVAFLSLSLVVVASHLSLAPTLLSTPAAGPTTKCATTSGCHSTTTSVVTTSVSTHSHRPDPSTASTLGGATTSTWTLQYHQHRPRINCIARKVIQILATHLEGSRSYLRHVVDQNISCWIILTQKRIKSNRLGFIHQS